MRIFGRNLSYVPILNTQEDHSANAEEEQLLPPEETETDVVLDQAMASSTNQPRPFEPPPPKPDMNAPPPYEEVDPVSFQQPTDMTEQPHPPTYEEVQRLKAIEAGEELPAPPPPVVDASGVHVMRIPNIGNIESQTDMSEEQILGTDFMFFIAFTATFIFNWVGFVLLLCFCHTIAGRTGALAGFGLSLAKWTFIVRHSMELVDADNTWLLWIIMMLGLLVFVRGVLQYVNAKKEFMKLSQGTHPQLVFLH